MFLYLGGAEIPSWKTLLAEQEVTHVGMSYMGLRRRTKFSKPWLIEEKFPANQKIFLDSGAYTINSALEDKYSQAELKDIAAHYMTFVQDNIDRVEMVSEFDALPLGREWIEAAREDFWEDIGDKFLPIWHGGDLDALASLAQRYKRVGIVQTALGDRNLAPSLNGLVQKYGTLLHGVAMTKPTEMAAIRWDSVASTSWISPSQYGDSVTGDTRIWCIDSKGVALREVESLWESGDLQWVRTVNGGGQACWKPASVLRHELAASKKIYRVTMEGGHSLKVTGDHSLFRLNNGAEEHVLTEDISPGDRLLVAPGSLSETRYLDFTDDFCTFLGLFVADGHHDSGTAVGISGLHDAECFDLFRKIANEWGANYDVRSNGVDGRIFSTKLSRYLTDLGFHHGSKARQVPSCVFRFNPTQVSAFLRGYFSGDGCGHKRTITAASVSPRLLDDLCYLLETFDILPVVGRKPQMSGGYGATSGVIQLSINDGDSVAKFMSQIGFLQTYKNVAATPYVGNPGTRGRRFQPKNRPEGNTRYDRVHSIETVDHEQFVYDLSVPGPERFWANGVIAHNTIVWTGKELKRYPKAYKAQARKQHRTLFLDKGFDAAKIEADDNKEILRLSIWSWQQQIADISRHSGVTTPPDEAQEPNAETGGVGVDTPPDENRKVIATREERETTPLPVMGLGKTSEHYTDDDGARQTRDLPLVEVRSASMRICDTCFLKDKCPGFKPNANCLYNIPVELKTKDQYRALQDSLIEMQTQRVLFMKMAEDMEGGYADPNLSNEVDRLQKLIAAKHDMESESFSLNIQAKGSPGQAGMISRLFGKDPGEQARALPAPVSADRLIEANDVFEAELVDLPIPHNDTRG